MPNPDSTTTALIAFGGNAGDPPREFHRAIAALDRAGLAIEAVSRLWRTKAVGGPPGQADFQNGAIRARTRRGLDETMQVLHELEKRGGRTRKVRWGPRSIDLDLLLFDNAIVDTANLCVPHPRMTFRRFVLDPACEIGGELIEPITGMSLATLRNLLSTRLPRIVWWTADRVAARRVVEQLAAVSDGRFRWSESCRSSRPTLHNEREPAADEPVAYDVALVPATEDIRPYSLAARLTVVDHTELGALKGTLASPYLRLTKPTDRWPHELQAAIASIQGPADVAPE